MDRGAARSRKRAQKWDTGDMVHAQAQAAQPAAIGPNGIRAPVEAGPSRERQGKARDKRRSEPAPSSKSHPEPQKGTQATHNRSTDNDDRRKKPRHRGEEKEEQSRDPALYRPKAIRDSTALVYSSAPFEIPPSLRNVTRLDLEGSNVSDITWIKGSGVTWLSLKGCPVKSGWEAVGSLYGLTVLNISDCQLEALPSALSQLGKLKALVAMNNPWSLLDEKVVSNWTHLNSLIVSHSPHLSRLPTALVSLVHLSKLTFSHCLALTLDSLPDLSSLPLLRDVKMNNLPLLDKLPDHISTWGKGPMSSIEVSRPSQAVDNSDTSRQGAGLQSLDVGNCSLEYETIASVFLSETSSFPNLRSLTLHGNPFCASKPDYVQLLTGSSNLPRLQVVDNKRVKEKVKRESKEEIRARERMERKMKPSGSNEASSGTMRKWGTHLDPTAAPVGSPDARAPAGNIVEKPLGTKRKRIQASEQKHAGADGDEEHGTTKERDSAGPASRVPKKSKVNSKSAMASEKLLKAARRPDAVRPPAVELPVADTLDPASRQPPKAHAKPSKSQTSVVGIVEVRPEGVKSISKGKQAKRQTSKAGNDSGGTDSTQPGLDLRELFGKQDDGGLGVGSW